MKKITKLRLCNHTLLYLTIAILLSGFQLEINPNGNRIWVWLHIAVGTAFFALIFVHLSLHHKSRPKTPNPDIHAKGKNMHFLGITFLLTLISGIAATLHWLETYTHSTLGGIHGKIGFLFIIAIAFHVRRYIKFFAPKRHISKKSLPL